MADAGAAAARRGIVVLVLPDIIIIIHGRDNGLVAGILIARQGSSMQARIGRRGAGRRASQAMPAESAADQEQDQPSHQNLAGSGDAQRSQSAEHAYDVPVPDTPAQATSFLARDSWTEHRDRATGILRHCRSSP